MNSERTLPLPGPSPEDLFSIGYARGLARVCEQRSLTQVVDHYRSTPGELCLPADKGYLTGLCVRSLRQATRSTSIDSIVYRDFEPALAGLKLAEYVAKPDVHDLVKEIFENLARQHDRHAMEYATLCIRRQGVETLFRAVLDAHEETRETPKV